MHVYYPMAIEPGSRYPPWPWSTPRGTRQSTRKDKLITAAKLWRVFRRQPKVTISATYVGWPGANLERSNAKRQPRTCGRNPIGLTVCTDNGPGRLPEAYVPSSSTSSTTTTATPQTSVFDSSPPSPASSTTTCEPLSLASDDEDLVVIDPVEFLYDMYLDTSESDSELSDSTEFWYGGILPEGQNFPCARDDSPFIRPFTPATASWSMLRTLSEFPRPPPTRSYPHTRPTNPEPSRSPSPSSSAFRCSSQNNHSSLRAAALRKSFNCNSHHASPLGVHTPTFPDQKRESPLRLPPTIPSLKPPEPLRFSKRPSQTHLLPVSISVSESGRNSSKPTDSRRNPHRNSSRRKCESLCRRASRRNSHSHTANYDYEPLNFSPPNPHHTHTRNPSSSSPLMFHILSTLQAQEAWEQDGDAIRAYFARKPTLVDSVPSGKHSRGRRADDDMLAERRRALMKLHLRCIEDEKEEKGKGGGVETDVEDLFSVCAGHFRAVVSTALSFDELEGGNSGEKKGCAGRRESEMVFKGRQWCEVLIWMSILGLKR